MLPDCSRLFLPGDFRWHLGLRPGEGRAFFTATEEQPALIAERVHWLDATPEEYAGLTTAGAPLLAEAVALAQSWGAMLADDSLLALGRAWEPDFVLLSLDERGPIVEGGAVCFPTSWSLREKIGRTLTDTHGPVPRLNAELAARIAIALGKLAPGTAWERDNWGLVRTPERNLHPRLTRPRLDAMVKPEEVWLRTERQILFKLPQTGGVLFGIRIGVTPLSELLADREASAALHTALVTMPEEAADYKGLSIVKPVLLNWLAQVISGV